VKNVLSFEPQLISEDELQNRLKNPNTEGIFVPEVNVYSKHGKVNEEYVIFRTAINQRG